jgi:tRNA modification GTPase
MFETDTIAAVSSPPGTGAIAVIRLSGPSAFEICSKIFTTSSGKVITGADANTLHYGTINDGTEIIDEVITAAFRSPHSYTGENLIEISCHGSLYVQKKILELMIANGAKPADPGEFTRRAFMNGKLDLTQVEAVADLIYSGSKTQHRVAISQMRGGFAKELSGLRAKLVDFISQIELELDFSEEDVEFADRHKLKELLDLIIEKTRKIRNSFELGNVIKSGIPVAIAGGTNSGKSTLLNLLLKEDKAIVSEIAGTTRDTIEDVINIRGLNFRLIDTAGLRSTDDAIEKLGIERTWKKIRQAYVILQVLDAKLPAEKLGIQVKDLAESIKGEDKKRIVLLNKIDLLKESEMINIKKHLKKILPDGVIISVSAKKGTNLNLLEDALVGSTGINSVNENDVIITNIRHFNALEKSLSALERTAEGLRNGIPGDLLALDVRESLHYLGEITGEITDKEILGNIFSKFCIGK